MQGTMPGACRRGQARRQGGALGAYVSGPSWLGGEVLEDTAATDNSSTDGNNNDVSGMSDGAPSAPGQHVADASPPRDAEVVVSAVLK